MLTSELSLDSTLMVAMIQEENLPIRLAIEDISTIFSEYYPLIKQLHDKPEG